MFRYITVTIMQAVNASYHNLKLMLSIRHVNIIIIVRIDFKV